MKKPIIMFTKEIKDNYDFLISKTTIYFFKELRVIQSTPNH